jgi:hypothetical protein
MEVLLIPSGAVLLMEFKQLPQQNARLDYCLYNIFIATLKNKSLKVDSYLTFALNADGSVDQVKLKIIDPDSDLTFHDVLLKPVR